MMMTKRKRKMLVVLAAILLALSFVAMRAVPRWLVVRKTRSSPEIAAMLAVTPESKIQVTPPDTLASPPISVGYAQFSLPPGLDPHMTSGFKGSAVLLETDLLWLGFLPPEGVDATELLSTSGIMKEMGNTTRSEWVAERRLSVGDGTDPESANFVDMQLLAHEARPLPFATIFMMSHAEFTEYTSRMIVKMTLLNKAMRIIPYEAPYSVGVIYLQEGDIQGVVELTTYDRRISQSISFKIDEPSARLPSDTLSAFLATYRFTIPSCPPEDQIAEMIAASGILPSIPPEED